MRSMPNKMKPSRWNEVHAQLVSVHIFAFDNSNGERRHRNDELLMLSSAMTLSVMIIADALPESCKSLKASHGGRM